MLVVFPGSLNAQILCNQESERRYFQQGMLVASNRSFRHLSSYEIHGIPTENLNI